MGLCLKKSCLVIIANIILFMSSLFLLFNLAPLDLSPSYRNQLEAISKLKISKNILGVLPSGINVEAENSGMSIVYDPETFSVLKEVMQKYSPTSKDIDWKKAIGVGYSILSAPVGNYTIEAIKPLYVVLIPSDSQSTTLILKPIGQLEDMEKWLSTQHTSSLILTAVILLIIGFLLQLLNSIVNSPDRDASVRHPENSLISL